MTSFVNKGSCLCGGVRFEVGRIEPRMGHCHCRMCRKFHGAAFATYGEAMPDQFRWLAGEELLSNFRADNGTTRQFCSRCGSSLTFGSKENPEGRIEFALGALDSELELKPEAHIFTDFKADWVEINDELPQFPHGR